MSANFLFSTYSPLLEILDFLFFYYTKQKGAIQCHVFKNPRNLSDVRLTKILLHQGFFECFKFIKTFLNYQF